MADRTCSFHSVKLFLASFSDTGHPISDPIREKAAGCPEEVAMDESIKKRPSSDYHVRMVERDAIPGSRLRVNIAEKSPQRGTYNLHNNLLTT
jgi:hypothetical protein